MSKETWSKATEREKAEKLLGRWEELVRKRNPYFNQWKEVSKLVDPNSGCFDVKSHNEVKDLSYILNSEATFNLGILSAGLMSGASSPARAWFKLQPTNPEFSENYDVINYCDEVQKILLRVFSMSNTYNTLHSIYKELALFGIAADVIYEDYDTAIKHHLLSAGEYCVETNHNGDIDTLYRNFELTTSQALKTFGYEKLPKAIQVAYDRGQLDQYWEFIHAIEPRLDRDFKSATNEHFEWGSYYICIGAGNPTIIRESGFNYFPVVCPRWEVSGLNAYGTSPSMNCLPDIRQLQMETLRKAELIEHYVKPALQAPNSARQQPINLSSGAVNFVQNTSNENSIKPIVQSMGDLNALRQDIAEIKADLKRAYFVDLFQMVQQTAGDRRTTVEIYALQQEQMLSLGAVVERVQNECLGRLVNITYQRLLDSNSLPPVPQVMQGQKLNVEFTSVLAQSQKAVDINSVDRLFSAMASAGQIMPEIYDRLNPDGYVDEYRDRLGVAPKILRSKEEAQKIREQRAQAQQQQAEQEQALAQAQQQQTLMQAQKAGAEASLAMQSLDAVGGGAMY